MSDLYDKRAEAEMKLADKKRIEEIKKMKNTLEYKLGEDIKSAMKNKEKTKLEALRAVKTELARVKAEKGSDGEVSEAKEIAALNKMVKQRTDSATIYREQNKIELAEIEEEQIEYIKVYLPKQLTEEEVEAIIAKIVADTGAESMRDMGKVMGAFKKDYDGQAPGKLVSDTVKKVLS